MGTHKSGSLLPFLPTMACSRGGQGFPEAKRELADWARIESPPSPPDTQQLTHPRAKCWCSSLSRVCGPHSFVTPRAPASCLPNQKSPPHRTSASNASEPETPGPHLQEVLTSCPVVLHFEETLRSQLRDFIFCWRFLRCRFEPGPFDS
jgi:hypothetical protein